jgi:alginate biosynthesis protein AlgX
MIRLLFLFLLLMIGSAQADNYLCPALKKKESYKSWPSFRYLVEGKDGWIFRTQTDFKSDFTINEAAGRRLQRLNAALADKNVKLVLSVLPTRGMMHGQGIVYQDYDRAASIQSYIDLITHLRGLGLAVAGTDSFDTLKDYYYRRDHHWTSVGAEDMAANVAALMDIKFTPVTFKTESQGKIDHKGTFKKPVSEICGTDLSPEKVDGYATYRSGGEDDLLGTVPEPEIVLVGTSNSTNDASHANFDGFLKQAIGADVFNASVSGGGADNSILKYLTSDAFTKKPPKVLIWEFPVYQGFSSSTFLRQAVASAYGDCGDKAIISKDVPISGSDMDIFSELSASNIKSSNYYLTFLFSEFKEKEFNVDLIMGDGEVQNFDFQRDRFYEPDGRFYVELKKSIMPLDTIKIHVPDGVKGTLKASICKKPAFAVR